MSMKEEVAPMTEGVKLVVKPVLFYHIELQYLGKSGALIVGGWDSDPRTAEKIMESGEWYYKDLKLIPSAEKVKPIVSDIVKESLPMFKKFFTSGWGTRKTLREDTAEQFKNCIKESKLIVNFQLLQPERKVKAMSAVLPLGNVSNFEVFEAGMKLTASSFVSVIEEEVFKNNKKFKDGFIAPIVEAIKKELK